PHFALDKLGRFAPVDTAFRLVDLRGVSCAELGLRLRFDPVELRQRLDHQPCADLCQLVVKLAAGLVLYRHARGREHGPGIEAAFHAHDGDAGYLVARQDRALDRRCAAPARQEAGMDVQATQRRPIQDWLRQDQAIGHHDPNLGFQREEARLGFDIVQALGVTHFDAERFGCTVNRGRLLLLAASGATGRLSVDGGDFVPRFVQSVKRRHGGARRAHESYAHKPHSVAPESVEGPARGLRQAQPERIWGIAMASQEIEALAGALARLPGLGPRSARRAVLWLVKRRETALVQLLEALGTVRERLVECRTCGNVDTQDPCGICADPRRDARQLCVVEDVADLWALDRARL